MSDLDLDALESRVNQRNGMSGVIVAKPLLRELLQAAREARRLRGALERVKKVAAMRYMWTEEGMAAHLAGDFAVANEIWRAMKPVVSTEETPE